MGSADANRGCLADSIEAEREAQGARRLNKNCEESMPPFSRLITDFRYKYHGSPL